MIFKGSFFKCYNSANVEFQLRMIKNSKLNFVPSRPSAWIPITAEFCADIRSCFILTLKQIHFHDGRLFYFHE